VLPYGKLNSYVVGMIFTIFGVSAAMTLYFALLSKIGDVPSNQAHGHGTLTNHSILGAGFLVTILLHTPKSIFLVVAAVSITLFGVGSLLHNSPAVPVRVVEGRCREYKGRRWGVTCDMHHMKIAPEAACYFKVNGQPVRPAWTNNSDQEAAAFPLTFICDPGPGETAHVTGPFFTCQSPHASIPYTIAVYCSYKGFAEAHSLLHARKGQTYIVWVGPKPWLLRRFKRDYACTCGPYILVAGESHIEPLWGERMGNVERIAQLRRRYTPIQSIDGDIGTVDGYYLQPDGAGIPDGAGLPNGTVNVADAIDTSERGSYCAYDSTYSDSDSETLVEAPSALRS
ncbi:hypothetical protein ED733_000002, partial [Metarhizium rileyi]